MVEVNALHPAEQAERLRMQGLGKAFGATTALRGVDLSVSAGEVHALIGENGAGKSTLMKILAGAVRPDAGSMLLDGAPFAPRNPLDARERGVAMIYQELSLAPHLSVAENILLGVEPHRFGLMDRARMDRIAERAVRELGHPEIMPRTPVGRLPVAAQQLVEIARALVVQCRVLVLDEPTSSLAADDVARLFGVIRRLRARGLAIVYISHFLEEVREIADRFTVLRDGQRSGGGVVAGTSIERMVGLMVGREVGEMFPRSARTPGAVVLELDGLAGRDLPKRAGLALREGEVFGIAGLVGAGRTELMRAVFGLDPVRHGRIRVGAVFGPASPACRLRQGVGLLSEDRKNEGLAASMSVADNLTLSKLGGFGHAGLIGARRQVSACSRWLDLLAVRCRGPRQRVCDLSGGNQQKVALARLLHHDVDVLLMDEPTRGIDVGSKVEIYRRIDALATRERKSVILVSSYLPELLGMADRIAVMARGVLGHARPVGEWTEESLMRAATGRSVVLGTGAREAGGEE